jgi:hypothetical protein
MRSNAWPEYTVAVVAACWLEAAWISLAYVTVGSLTTHQPAPLPMLAFAGATFVGLGYARRWAIGRRHPYSTPVAAIAVAVAIIGWLLPLGSGAVRVFEDPLGVIGMHPGGILLGLAVIRGTAHVTPADDERIAETALGPGLIVVGAIWVLLTATGGTRQPPIVDAVFSATVAFITAGLLSIGLARLAGLRSAGVIGAERGTWVGLLVGVVAGLLVLTMPLALILGVPLDDAIRGALGPVGEVIVAVVTIMALPVGLLAGVLVLLLESLRGNLARSISSPGGFGGPVATDWGSPLGLPVSGGLILGLVALVIAIVVAFLLTRGLLRRPLLSTVESDLIEVRERERPTGGFRLRRPYLPIPRRHFVPRTASEAYLASLEVLGHRPEAARRETETPAEHARRLRASPIGLPLSRLAADYALAEFGQRTLTSSEHRRGVERWRRIRSLPGP